MANKLKLYYTEYPETHFGAESDEEALEMTNAKVVYRESDDSEDGRPFVMLRDRVLPCSEEEWYKL